MSDNTNSPGQRVQIPPMTLVLDWTAIDVIMEGLSKLTIERAGNVHHAIGDAAQKHVNSAIADAQKPGPDVRTPEERETAEGGFKPAEAS